MSDAASPRLRRLAPALIALATLALFVFANLRSPLPNDDGVLYVLLAERIRDEGLHAAFALFDRPFYSAMIAGLASLSGLALTPAAQLLDGACAILLALAFADLCRQLYGDARVLPWAALVFLAHPKLNNYFAFVIRDLGYWALLLASFSLWLRHLVQGRLLPLAGWALATLFAAAFKPEAALFGVLLPLTLPWQPGIARAARWRRIGLALGLVLVPLAGFVLVAGAGSSVPPVLRELPHLPGELLRGIPEAFLSAAERYASGVLDPYSRDVAAISLAGGLTTILLVKILNALGPVQLVLLAIGARAGVLRPAVGRGAPYLAMIGGATLLALLFLGFRQFLDTRYVMLLCFLLLAPAARALHQVAERASASASRARRVLLPLLVAALALDFALGLDRSKPHMLECVAWMRTHVAPGSRVFSNDKQLAATSGAQWDWNEVQGAGLLLAERRAPLAGTDLWIMHLRGGQPEPAASLEAYLPQLEPVTEFAGERGERILVYRPLGNAVPPPP